MIRVLFLMVAILAGGPVARGDTVSVPLRDYLGSHDISVSQSQLFDMGFAVTEITDVTLQLTGTITPGVVSTTVTSTCVRGST